MTYRSLPKALSLAFVIAAASFGPLLVPGTALAEAPQEAAPGASAPAKTEKPKHAAKAKKKAKKSATAKAHAKATHTKAAAKADKSDKSASPPAKTKRSTARENKPSTKRAKAPAKTDDSPQSSAAPATGKASKTSCAPTTVSLDRGGVEGERIALVDCQGKVLDAAIAKVSVLARPWGAPRRAVAKAKRIDAGIVARIDAVAKRFPGRTITLVGAPATTGSGSSAHQAGRAVDLRVDGVDNQKVAEACRALDDTSCGFYPNASFVHIDARAKGAGKAYWIDASEPGEPPRYVTSWPPASASTKPEPASK